MCFLKIILLLLIPSYISGSCKPNISMSGRGEVCSGQDFTITCQFACHGRQHHVKLVKDKQILDSLESSNYSITLSKHVRSANKNDSGKYNCETEPMDSISIVSITVQDCVSTSKYVSTASKTSSLISTYQSPPRSSTGIVDPVLIWYILFKTGVFLIGSIIAALCAINH